MIANNFKALTCLGCELKCDYANSDLFHDLKCDDKKLVVWPDDNYYFNLAINELVFKRSFCYHQNGIIIVDLSIYHLAFFLNENWIDFLKKTNLHVTLIAGHGMLPLANFWAKKAAANWIILNGCDLINADFKTKKKIINTFEINLNSYPSLSDDEMYTLRLMKKGCSNHDIATHLQCEVRHVYRLQDAIRKKMRSPNFFRGVMFKQAISTTFNHTTAPV